MPNRIRKAAVLLAVVGSASVLASAPAFAASTATAAALISSNWAGYYSLADAPITGVAVDFTVPKVNCANSRGSTTPRIGYRASMWIGIGGMNRSTGPSRDNWLEQDGVQVLCSSLHAKPVYEPFYEIVPTKKDPDSYYHEAVIFTEGKAPARVAAGDSIAALINPPANSSRPGSWEFTVEVDSTDGTSRTLTAYAKLPSGTYTGNPGSTARDTVEVITECPTVDLRPTGFVDLGTVSYTYADYFTSDSQWLAIPDHPIVLVHPLPGPVAVSPGAPYTPGDSVADDSFNTSYASNWWR